MVGQIAAMFERAARVGSLAIDHPEFAAEQFLQLVVSLPQRRALGLGEPMTEAELDAWANDSSTCSSMAAASGRRTRQDRRQPAAGHPAGW